MPLQLHVVNNTPVPNSEYPLPPLHRSTTLLTALLLPSSRRLLAVRSRLLLRSFQQ